ncbi:MAG: hypothetical protein LAN61_02735 [Acidobacteriia bacterium]|nr:hypothetical protein [Terriglobia bacterium]
MADWKQIQARIRRARTGADPAGQLEKLYEKTRDAMAAFELARHFEAAGQMAQAARWYRTASEGFRRADWKKKAEEAAARLAGGAVTEPPHEAELSSTAGEAGGKVFESETNFSIEEPSQAGTAEAAPAATLSAASAAEEGGSVEGSAPADRKRRRRGRRGGRKHRRGREAAAATPAAAETLVRPARPEAREPRMELPAAAPVIRRVEHEPTYISSGEATGPGPRARSGDPALSSRLAHLEMQLRRLLASPLSLMEHADRAPAGPGVFLITDADQTTYYYAENCATLRIGIANFLRSSGTSRRGEESIKERFADHLGIPEARVSKYVNDHCVVRWLQLDEGASTFAHFVIALLRPVLND